MHTLECNEYIHVYGIDPKASLNQLTMSIHHRGHIYVDVPVSCIALHLYTYMNKIIYCTQAPHRDINILQQFTQPWGYR